MGLHLRRRAQLPLPWLLAAALVACLPCAGAADGGGVTSSTNTRNFRVEGSTATALVRFMNGHPLQGDHGAAYASIHPNYELMLTTRREGAMCVPARVVVHVDFELTLPVAASPGAMSKRTRSAWAGFAAFARAHENHHKASYLGCARAFVGEARRRAASQCFALEADLRGRLATMKRACEAKQAPFDRAQAQILPRLALFAMARSGARK